MILARYWASLLVSVSVRKPCNLAHLAYSWAMWIDLLADVQLGMAVLF